MIGIRDVKVGKVTIGAGKPFVLIAGPDSIESREHLVRMARELKAITEGEGVPWILKASWDKANRASAGAWRGVGLREGVDCLKAVRLEVGCARVTDVHETWQATQVAVETEMLQVPALLSRQTDLIRACSLFRQPVLLKKGQFMAAGAMRGAVEKAEDAPGVVLCERGNCFGYGRLVVDFTNIPRLAAIGWPVAVDCSHPCQLPSDEGGASGGVASDVGTLAACALAAGAHALFIEVHDDPANAPCDGAIATDLKALPALLRRLRALQVDVPEVSK